ncbi:hypothetical protein PRJH_3338 [Providencia rustigianii]
MMRSINTIPKKRTEIDLNQKMTTNFVLFFCALCVEVEKLMFISRLLRIMFCSTVFPDDQKSSVFLFEITRCLSAYVLHATIKNLNKSNVFLRFLSSHNVVKCIIADISSVISDKPTKHPFKPLPRGYFLP